MLNTFKLKKLNEDDYHAFLEMANDYTLSGEEKFKKYCSPQGFQDYLTEISNFSNSETVPQNYVPSLSFFLVDVSGNFFGSIRLRKGLNENLLIEGGHIGYDIRPSLRNKGYATQMLSLCLEEARKIGLQKVLVTCYIDNPASSRVIEKNCGKLESIEPSPRNGKETKRYWIKLTTPKS